MTKFETSKIIMLLKISGLDFKAVDDLVIDLWADLFKEDKYEDVFNAVNKLLKQEKQLFVNGLIAKIKDLLVPATMFKDSSVAWNDVRIAMNNTYADIPRLTHEAFAKLDPIIRKVLGNSHILIEWEHETSTDDMNTVIKSNFIKEYNYLCKVYRDDLKSGGKMLENLEKPRLNAENKENIKKLEGLTEGISGKI